MSLEADVHHAGEQTLKTFGRLDIAFNNAGVDQDPKPRAEQTEDEFDRILAIVNNASVAAIRGRSASYITGQTIVAAGGLSVGID